MRHGFRRDLIVLSATPLIASLALMLSRLHRQLPHTQVATFLVICVAAVVMLISYRRCGAMASTGKTASLRGADPPTDVIWLNEIGEEDAPRAILDMAPEDDLHQPA